MPTNQNIASEKAPEMHSPEPIKDPEPTKPIVSGWAIKDWVTVVFSTASLLLASAGFYFSNLLVDHRLIAQIADVTMHYPPDLTSKTESSKAAPASTGTPVSNPTAEEIPAPNADAVEITLALTNLGNRPVCLFDLWYHVAYKGDIREGGQGNQCEADSNVIPALIPPHEMRLIRVRIPQSHLQDLHDSGAAIENDPTGRHLTWKLEFVCFDSQGGKHEEATDFRGTMRVIPEEKKNGRVIPGGATHASWGWVLTNDGKREYPPVTLVAH
jgi:hypothetical protein